MRGETVFITGTSSGIGLLTALELAKRGYTVIAAMRSLERGAELRRLSRTFGLDEKMIFFELDVASSESLNRFTEQVQTLPPIDILINNAGFAYGGFCEETSIQEYKEQFETNLFGVIGVTQAVLPSMRNRRRGRIINMSSISGRTGFPGLSPYAASKHALEGWTECLRLEVKPFGIDIALVEPGSFKTSIWDSGKKIAEKSKLNSSPYKFYMEALETHLMKSKDNYGNPIAVASFLADLCMKKKINKLRYPIGKGVKTAVSLKYTLPWKWWENIIFASLNLKESLLKGSGNR
ncbi:SDR family oxidoreductase [Siminovitchia sediminis]|uniref:SDR family oxidoreductase n=1 Tax=Siminovitchia sediminis TaxID=1274353 RepID=A0ABW4KC22_9BACI